MQSLLDSRQLRAFVVLARHENYTHAAAELHLTQSAISHAMRHLQDQLECALLYKVGKKVLLTERGKAFLRDAEGILNAMDQAVRDLQSTGMENRGRLQIGCSVASSQFILPPVLREFKDCFPRYEISIQPGDTRDLVEELEHHRIDLAVCLMPQEPGHFETRKLFEDELHYIVSPRHPWTQSGKMKREDLARTTFILYSRRSITFELFENHLLNQGVRLGSFIEMGSFEAIKELVKLGLGVGVMAPWVTRAELESGSLVAISIRPKLKRKWAVLTLQNRPLRLAEETFIGLCQAAAANLSLLQENRPAPR
ncbi:MAG: LysR family transcriptional regulator [Methylacidiphilales bacterium]|nr:LysR family transcriptional regulator [Candidatus Methylacidiphilales bacterium]